MRIGVTPYCRENDCAQPYLPDGYRKGVEARGGELVVFYYTESDGALLELLTTVDGFIYSGGPDVHPARYGRAVEPDCGKINLRRDEVEFLLFPEILRRDMPVLAICRGMQFANVALGGTLIQHVGGHQQKDGDPGHQVRILPGTRLYELAGGGSARVNTYHHQCVDGLAESLTPAAYDEGGILEAARRPASRFFAAYQWHPELMLGEDALANRIFDDFMDACGNRPNI